MCDEHDLPSTRRQLSDSVLLRIDAICERFETAWRDALRDGREPPCPPALNEIADPLAALQLVRDLIAIDIEHWSRHLGEPAAETLHARWSGVVSVAEMARLLARLQPAPPPPPLWQTGELIANRYRVAQLLGQGGMGAVYLARDEAMSTLVALKVLRVGDVEVLQQEVRLAQAVTHTNVCAVRHLDVSTPVPFVVMEYVPGQSLERLLRQSGPLKEERARQLVTQICEGLQAVHDRGVLHCDLKPANVLIDERGHVRLADFGLARLLQSAPRVTGGTIRYMSPEQLPPRGEITRQSDIYALGLLLFEIYTGRRLLYESDELAALIERRDLQIAEVREFYQLSPGVRETIENCLQFEPRHRPSSAAQVSHLLTHVLPDIAGIRDRVPMAHWSRRLAIAALGVVLVCLALIVALSDRVTLLGRSTVDNPSDLRGAASAILRLIGSVPADRAGGFISRSGGYRVLPGKIYYAYRESPGYLIPNQFFPIDYTLWPSFVVGLVTPDNPAPVQPGMVSLWLDGRGGLVRLRVVPGTQGLRPFRLEQWCAHLPEATIEADWQLHTHPANGGLDYVYDKLTVFRAQDRDGKFWLLTIGEHQGEIAGIDCNLEGEAPLAVPADRPSPFAGTELYLLLLVVAATVAVRNIWRGFCDHTSSIKVAVAVFLLALAGHLLVAHHQWSASELDILEICLAMSLYLAFVGWIAYVAIEPFVRRHLPEALISWGRLLNGRVADPLIARDLLLGIALSSLSLTTSHVIFGWLRPDALFEGMTTGLSDTRVLAGLILVWWSFDIALSMLMLVSLVLARRYLWPWVARIACVLLWTLPFTTPHLPSMDYLNIVVSVMLTAATILVLEKYGFLPIVISWLARLLLLGPITADSGRWYFATSLCLILILIAGAVYGYWRTSPLPRAAIIPPA